MANLDQIKVPLRECEHAIRVQASRFVAHIARADSEAGASEFLERLRRQYHDATHHCWAFVVGAPDDLFEKSSDAGEPTGTAGRPILDEIHRSGLVNALCVVVRYFGGTKLGTGGLKRAYGDAARSVCENCEKRTLTIAEELEISFPHESTGRAYHLIESHGGRIVGKDYGSRPLLTIQIARSQSAGITDALREAGHGKIQIESHGIILME